MSRYDIPVPRQQRACYDLPGLAERELLVSALDRHSSHFQRHQKLRAQPLRLETARARQLAPAHARGKSQIVLDPRTRCRLAARRVAIEQNRSQSL